MTDTKRRTFESPQIVPLGGVRELTEGITTPVAEGYGGSGRYYDASKGVRKSAKAKKKATGGAKNTPKKSVKKAAKKR